MAKYYVGDVGTTIIVDTGMDITGATTTKYRVKKPSSETVTWDAVLGDPEPDGEIHNLTYTVASGDWDEEGCYTLQAYVVIGTWSGLGDAVKFRVTAAYN